MTRRCYNGCVDAREREVRRLLERYLVEVVEAYQLCPWAHAARAHGELAIAVLWAMPPEDLWVATAQRLLSEPRTRVAMIVAPELGATLAEFRALRDRVAARVPAAGVAEFHPEAALELATPAKLVPFLRRAPDALLQLVPLALLENVRAAPPPAALADQARMLGGHAPPGPGNVVERIAAANHARVAADPSELEARFAELAADRARAYARAGMIASRRE
jgi:hypothetical protein